MLSSITLLIYAFIEMTTPAADEYLLDNNMEESEVEEVPLPPLPFIPPPLQPPPLSLPPPPPPLPQINSDGVEPAQSTNDMTESLSDELKNASPGNNGPCNTYGGSNRRGWHGGRGRGRKKVSMVMNYLHVAITFNFTADTIKEHIYKYKIFISTVDIIRTIIN